jgi:hypothetical protein
MTYEELVTILGDAWIHHNDPQACVLIQVLIERHPLTPELVDACNCAARKREADRVRRLAIAACKRRFKEKIVNRAYARSRRWG